MRAGQFITEATTTLNNLYNGKFPDRYDTFWDYVRPYEFDKPLKIHTLSKFNLVSTLLSQYRVEHIDELVAMLNDDQRETVETYMQDQNISNRVILISDNRIIDGNHRALAAALNGVGINYVDLAELDEQDVTEGSLNEFYDEKSNKPEGGKIDRLVRRSLAKKIPVFVLFDNKTTKSGYVRSEHPVKGFLVIGSGRKTYTTFNDETQKATKDGNRLYIQPRSMWNASREIDLDEGATKGLNEFAISGDDDDNRPQRPMPLADVAKIIKAKLGPGWTMTRMRDFRGKFNPTQPGYKFVPDNKTKHGMAKIWCVGDRKVGEYDTYNTSVYVYHQRGRDDLIAAGRIAERAKPKTVANALVTAQLILNHKGGVDYDIQESKRKRKSKTRKNNRAVYTGWWGSPIDNSSGGEVGVEEAILKEWVDPGPPCVHCGKPMGQHRVRIVKKNPNVVHMNQDQEWIDHDIVSAENHEFSPSKNYKPLSQREAEMIGFNNLNTHNDDIYDLINRVRERISRVGKNAGQLKRIKEQTDNLNYIGNCTDDDVIEHIFGDATRFAQIVDEYGDDFELDDLVVKYDPESDIHSFYYKQQDVTESVNNNPIAQKIFFARSKIAPKAWSYDHVGFITQDGKQIQMSGHKGNEVYVTNTVTDDPEFPEQNIKVVSLPKSVSVPTTNTVNAENCGTFVANVLQANGIKGFDTQKLYSVMKTPRQQDVTESNDEITPAGYTWSFEHGGEVPWKSDIEVNTFIRVRDNDGKTVLGVWADVYGDDVEIQYSEVFDKKLRGKGIYTDFLKGLSKHYNIISDQDQNNAARNIYKKLGADYNSKTEKHTLRRSSQDVAEDVVDEMALSTYKTMGDFSKPGPFKDSDYKLVTHPVHIQKVTAFFEKTPQDFRFFMSNLPGMRKYRESGQKSPEEIKQIFGDKNAAEILQNSENAITVIYIGNFGQNRVMMTPHTIAHRIGHAITATGRYQQSKAIPDWEHLHEHFFKTLTAILSSYYNVSSTAYSRSPQKYDLEKQYLGLLYSIGTLKSSRERNLTSSYEFLYEMLAQYIRTGRVTLNPLPKSVGYGRLVGWKTKSFERYLRINQEYSDELFRKQVTDRLANDMSILFKSLLDSCVGKIFVM